MRPYYHFARFVSQAALSFYFHGRVFGREKFPARGGVLLASNHQSFFDPIAVTCTLPREGNYMARDTLFRNPLFNALISSLNAFPVKRGLGDVGAVKEILRRLKDGKVVVVFPEGTRTRDGSIGTINPNSMSLARRSGAFVVPAVVDGAFEAWPRTKLLPRSKTVFVTYADSISPEQFREWSDERVAEVVTERMKAALAESRVRRLRSFAHAWLER
jgi:1-acyl-sn-glycerol-3-phosphate acyltransferase